MTEVTVQKKGDGIAVYADNIQNNIQQAKKILTEALKALDETPTWNFRNEVYFKSVK